MEKKINYLARTFQDIRSELVDFSKKYYPELSNDFHDASIGSWFLDLVASVGDNLSYYIDRAYQTTNINTANTRKSLMNLARSNGVKVPGTKPSICELEFSTVLPVSSDNGMPDWDYAPIIKKASIVGNGSYRFETSEDVNFAEQFNEDGISNRKYYPNRNSNGTIINYKVSKTVLGKSGQSKIYKKVLGQNDVKPFMEIILPELNIMEVESIIFKESASMNEDPLSFEYKIEEEVFRLHNQSIFTYRYFEVESLSDQYRFCPETKYTSTDDLSITTSDYLPYVYDDYTISGKTDSSSEITVYDVRRYFRGMWKPITQKFITEYTDNGYLKIIFGCGTNYQGLEFNEQNDSTDAYSKYVLSRIVNNQQMGVLPKIGWTMYVRYRVGGGSSLNLAPNSITTLINANMEFDPSKTLDQTFKNTIVQAMTVTNPSVAVGGKDAPSLSELKYLIKYNQGAQHRCVTLKDYKERVMMMPPKYGAPFRCGTIEDNNKIVLSYLGLDASGKLDKALPQTLVDNIIKYLSHYKTLGDYVEMKSGRIYNLGFVVEVFIDKNYTMADVIKNVIVKIKEYMHVNNWDMGEDIFLGDLEREVNSLDGVIALINLKVYSLYGNGYSSDKCPLPPYIEQEGCSTSPSGEAFVGMGANTSFRIDIDAIDALLHADYNSMYEVKYDKDIKVKAKVK